MKFRRRLFADHRHFSRTQYRLILAFAAQWVFFLAVLISLLAKWADARIIKLEVKSTEHHGFFKTGSYIRVSGVATGELSISEDIPDLKQADPDGTGKVQYVTPFVLILPEELESSNGILVFDVENRGRPVTHFLYNSPRGFPPAGVAGLPKDIANAHLGIGYLENQGFILANASWELGHGVTLPEFKDRSGDRRYVEGVGFAVVRDLVAFLKDDSVDSNGNANPLVSKPAPAEEGGVDEGRAGRIELGHEGVKGPTTKCPLKGTGEGKVSGARPTSTEGLPGGNEGNAQPLLIP